MVVTGLWPLVRLGCLDGEKKAFLSCDVHVRWLAQTPSRPLAAWHTDASSPWGLDNPPLFAIATRGLAAVAAGVDGGSLVRLDGPPPTAAAAVLFMRASVMASDVVLAAGLARLMTALLPRRRMAAALAFRNAAAVLLHPGLLLVDHIHFPYNRLLLGVLLGAVAAAVEGASVLAAVAAAVAFNLKHMLVPAALPLGVHLAAAGLAATASTAAWRGGRRTWARLSLAAPTRWCCRGSPFSLRGGGWRRWRPYWRASRRSAGNCSTAIYWAANAWAVVTAADRGACAATRTVTAARVDGGGRGGAPRWLLLLLPRWAAAAAARAAASCAAAVAVGDPPRRGGWWV